MYANMYALWGARYVLRLHSGIYLYIHIDTHTCTHVFTRKHVSYAFYAGEKILFFVTWNFWKVVQLYLDYLSGAHFDYSHVCAFMLTRVCFRVWHVVCDNICIFFESFYVSNAVYKYIFVYICSFDIFLNRVLVPKHHAQKFAQAFSTWQKRLTFFCEHKFPYSQKYILMGSRDSESAVSINACALLKTPPFFELNKI